MQEKQRLAHDGHGHGRRDNSTVSAPLGNMHLAFLASLATRAAEHNITIALPDGHVAS